jgi:hypothetical protein
MNIPTRDELNAAGIRILLAIPMERQVPAQSFLHFWQIAMHGWPIVDRGYGRIDENRNAAASELLKSEYTHLCMLDLDHWHQPNIVEYLARHVLEDPDKLIISGLHFRRSEPYDPLVYRYEGGKPKPPLHWDKGLYEVDAVGHGSILISRQVFERIPPLWWAYAYKPDMVEHGYESDDMYFCRLCHKANIKIWCDTTLTSPHITEAPITEETFRLWMATHTEQVKQRGNNYAINVDGEGLPARHSRKGSNRRGSKAIRREKVPAVNGTI